MINMNNGFNARLKCRFRKIKGLISAAILVCATLSFIYFIYWAAVMTDDMILHYTQQYFYPLANLLSFGEVSPEIYRHASFVIACTIIPLILSHVWCDKIEESILNHHAQLEDATERKARAAKYLNEAKQFNALKNFSICLSLDYNSKREIEDKTKQTLNKIIYKKLDTTLSLIPNLSIISDDVFILMSDDFNNYDYIYGSMLKMLSKIKNTVDKKYDLELIPSITTDATTINPRPEIIKNKHKEIQSFNFQNRSLSTAAFSKKYKYMNQNKYAGVPIGEYATFGTKQEHTYELNVVSKNLIQTLAGL